MPAPRGASVVRLMASSPLSAHIRRDGGWVYPGSHPLSPFPSQPSAVAWEGVGEKGHHGLLKDPAAASVLVV
jgi:hypothetical protein